jgi:hypothetical protein
MTIPQLSRFNELMKKITSISLSDQEIDEYFTLLRLWNNEFRIRCNQKGLINSNSLIS